MWREVLFLILCVAGAATWALFPRTPRPELPAEGVYYVFPAKLASEPVIDCGTRLDAGRLVWTCQEIWREQR